MIYFDNISQVAVFGIFLIWFLISVIYIFKSKWLGRFGVAIHQLGWANKWTMFLSGGNATYSYALFYREKKHNGAISDWIEVEYPKGNMFMFIIHPKIALDSLYKVLSRKLLNLHHSGVVELEKNELFSYLCDVICDLKAEEETSMRQVKLVFISRRQQSEIAVIQSIFIKKI